MFLRSVQHSLNKTSVGWSKADNLKENWKEVQPEEEWKVDARNSEKTWVGNCVAPFLCVSLNRHQCWSHFQKLRENITVSLRWEICTLLIYPFTGLKNRLGKAFVDTKPKLGKKCQASFRSHFEYVPIWSSWKHTGTFPCFCYVI